MCVVCMKALLRLVVRPFQKNLYGVVILAVLAAIGSSAVAQTYELVASKSDSELYLQTDSIDRSGRDGRDLPSVNVLLNYPEGRSSSVGPAKSIVLHMFFDCTLKRKIITGGTIFSGPMGTGQSNYILETSNTKLSGSYKKIADRICFK